MLLARAQGVCLRVDGTTLKKLGILAIGATETALFLYSSYSYIPVGMATTLHFVYPALITLELRIFFHQRFTGRNVLTLALTLGGIVFMGASAEARANLTGMLLALISGVFGRFISSIWKNPVSISSRPQSSHFILLWQTSPLWVFSAH